MKVLKYVIILEIIVAIFLCGQVLDYSSCNPTLDRLISQQVILYYICYTPEQDKTY